MGAVEGLNGAYHYYGMVNLTAGELFFWIMVDETMIQLGVDDVVSVGMILLGKNNLSTRVKPGGAIKGTSRASQYSRRVFQKAQFPFGLQLPTLVGEPVRNVKIRMVRNIGTFVGRAIPVLGWGILASDIYTITHKTVSHYNKVAREVDRLW
ncbi:STM2901 family protein [Burkholderia anthina]|uniref:STM2901 family protein n=1 Tax=Burkholderia anthina TaxID=179879 RepID=UPI00158A2EA3